MRVTCQPDRLQQPGEVHRGDLAFGVRVRAQDDLLDALGLDPSDELADLELLGADPLERAHRAEQHVVSTAELAGLLDGHDVTRLLHHAHHRRAATVVAADRAQRSFGDVEASFTEPDARLGIGDREGEAGGVLGGHLQEVERDALRRLRSDAREVDRVRRSAPGPARCSCRPSARLLDQLGPRECLGQSVDRRLHRLGWGIDEIVQIDVVVIGQHVGDGRRHARRRRLPSGPRAAPTTRRRRPVRSRRSRPAPERVRQRRRHHCARRRRHRHRHRRRVRSRWRSRRTRCNAFSTAARCCSHLPRCTAFGTDSVSTPSLLRTNVAGA